MTEYIIIVFLVAIGTIGVVSLMGDNVRALFGSADNALAGNENTMPATRSADTLHWSLKGGDALAFGGGSGGGSGGGDSSSANDWWGSGESATKDDCAECHRRRSTDLSL